MKDFVNISYVDLTIAAGLFSLVILLSYVKKLAVAKEMTIAMFRSFLQLTAVGYVLDFIFSRNEWYSVIGMLLFMLFYAAYNGIKRVKHKFEKGYAIFITAMFCGAGAVLILTIFAVLRVKPWYRPQYIIPIFGMIGANAMNSSTLALNSLTEMMRKEKKTVMARLSLGLTPYQASLPVIQSAARNSLIPTINNMMVMGLVTLPGMMTGQIIGGVSPLQAVRYQIVIMYMISAGNTVTSIIAMMLAYKTFFTKRKQLKI